MRGSVLSLMCFNFHVSGTDVQFICAVTDSSSLDTAIVNKRINFLHNLHKFNCHHEILSTLLD